MLVSTLPTCYWTAVNRSRSDTVAPARPRELKSLTALRGVAAMAVVLQHFSATAQEYCRVTIPSLVPHGYVAVDFFFVLSGFIMAYTYLDSFRQRGMAAYGPFL
ncbi:MAG TPA: acyltransferase family protein, partial [Acetobacteraceae bacterium]|nr:acyltransferase family protein [Acetobacteraceae bacterium]